MLLKVYDQYKNAIGYIRKYTDLVIESELESGDKTLSFTYQVKNPKDIQNEYYIETQDDRFVVKEIGLSSDGYPEIVCQLDLETLEADMVESFSAVNVSIQEAANLALVGTGWLADTEGMDPEKLRSVATLKASPLTLLGKIKDAWMCELKYDTKNMIVYFRDQFGEDKGVFFSKSLNLRKLKLTDDSYDYYTRIVPIGEDDLRINDVNDGVGYVENYQYSNKIKTLIWEDTSYTDAEALKEDAEAKLDDMSKPAKSYSADVVALAKERPEYKILDFSLGDTITLLDQDSGIKDKQRIVKMKEYPDDPFKNTCELSNTTWTWEELQSKLQAAAAAFEDITNSDGSVNGYYVHGLTSDGVLVVEKVLNPDGTTTTEVIGSLTDNIQIIGQQSQEAYDAAVSVVGDIVTISGELDVVYERVGTLEATSLTVTEADIRYAQIGDLDVVTESVENLYALYADIQSAIIDEAAIRRLILSYGFITEADIETLRATVATIQDAYITYEEVNELLANYISTEQLDAVIGNIEVLNTSVANITYLLSGEESVGELTTIHLTSGNAVIDSAIIIDALMDDAIIGTLLAGIIYTDYITIMSENGGIVISGTTMQISDENGIVRMQLGQDADGGFTFIIYDQTGTGIMIDSEGIHSSAIPDGLIVNDMVAENAAIAGSKLDIQSVAECLTDDGTLQLNATQVLIDDTTLDYKLTEITQSIADIESDAVENVINFYALGGPDNPPCEPGKSIIDAIVGTAVIGETICGCVGWTTERLKAEEGEYLWYVQLIIYKDGSRAWTTPTLITDDYIRSTVSTAQTELQIIQGQIAAKIWESDITEATNSLGEEISEITDRYSQLVLTVDTIDERLGTLTTTMGEEFQSLYSEVTNITLQLGEIGLSVSEIYDYVDENITEVNESLAQIVISLEEIDLSVSSLEYDMTEYYSELSDQITEITLDLGIIDLKVSDVESKVDTSIKNATAYYAISESPTYYPTFGGDTVAIVGEAVIGKAILGNSGRWTEDQPTPESNEYLWIRWFVEKVDGETYWTEPTLLTNDTFKKDLAELQQRYAEIILDLDGIYLTVYQLQSTVAENYEEVIEKYSTIEMDVSSITSEVYSMQDEVGSLKEQYAGIQQEIKDTETNILAEVSNTYVSQSSLDYELDGYYTKEQTNAAILLQAADTSSTIMSQVSGTYATQKSLEDGLDDARDYTDSALELYPTTIEMTAYIKQYVDDSMAQITLAVGYEKDDQKDYTNCQNFSGGKLPDGWWEDETDPEVGSYEYITGEEGVGSYVRISRYDSSRYPCLCYSLGVLPAGKYSIRIKLRTEKEYTETAIARLTIICVDSSGNTSNDIREDINITNSDEWVTYEVKFEREEYSEETQFWIGSYTKETSICATDIQILYPADANTSALGNMASITLTSGGRTSVGELDLTQVRQAFANDASEITIAAGQINLIGDIFTMNASNFLMTEEGTISATDVTLDGILSNEDGKYKIIVTGGAVKYYYDNNQAGSLVANGDHGLNMIIYGKNFQLFDGRSGGLSGVYACNLEGDDYVNYFYKGVRISDGLWCYGGLNILNGRLFMNSNRIEINGNSYIGDWNSGSDMGFGGGDIYTNNGCAMWIGNVKYSGGYMLGVNGSAYATGGWAGTSDETLKDGILTLSSRTDTFIDKLNPISFYFKNDDKKKTHFGVTYQNVCEALESEGIEPKESGIVGTALDENGNEYGTLFYDELIAPLIYEVQQLKAEIAKLKKGAVG